MTDFSQHQINEYLKQLQSPNLTDEQANALIQEAKKWAEGGVYRVALHTITAVLATGSIKGVVSAGGVAYSIPKIDQYLEEQGFDKEVRDTALLALSAGIGVLLAVILQVL